VALHLAYRWFCKLDLDDKVPHHSTFSVNRLGRFRESGILRHIFERVVAACMVAGLVKGEGFAVDASVMEANASRYHGKAPDELDWTDAQRQKRAVAEYLAGLGADAQVQEGGDSLDGGSDGTPVAKPDRKPPKVISPSDPSSAWTAKANKRVQFGYGLNYLIDVEHAIIVDVEPTPARTYDEVALTKTMLERTERRLVRYAPRSGLRRPVPTLRIPAQARNDFEQVLDTPTANRRDNPELRKMRSDRVDGGSLLADQKMARAMKHQAALLLDRLDRHKPHVGLGDRFANRLRIGRVILLSLDVRLQRGGTSFNANEAWRQLRENAWTCRRFS
jgi:hypothetical protein